MDIREADPADVRAVSEMRQRCAPDFPSASALLRLRARLDILMPVARVDTDADEIQLSAEQPAGFLEQLEQSSGYRSLGSVADSFFGAGPGPRLVKRLNVVRPIWGTSGSA